jgi:3-oxoacyl-[acyl-carrier-protein] synthase-1
VAYFLNTLGIICALGDDKASVYQAMVDGRQDGMVATREFSPGRERIVGTVGSDLPAMPPEFAQFDCRNNRLLLAALSQIRPTLDDCVGSFGAQRIGVVLATSTSGINEGEKAIRQFSRTSSLPETYHFQQQQLSGPSDFLTSYLQLGGPAMTISTACSSSANALASARRLLQLDTCDAVLVGGADTLCQLTVQGFSALEAMSPGISNPCSRNRDGINIGEGAALMLLSKRSSEIELLGVGSTCDAHHISAPDPTGNGARRAMQAALTQASMTPAQVDYLNLHGTGTALNDAMECKAVSELLGNEIWCSASKPMTGHTLGAAGAIEVGLCWLLLSEEYNSSRRILPHLWDGAEDDELPHLHLATTEDHFATAPSVCMSNSFAFGGNNASVLLGCGR